MLCCVQRGDRRKGKEGGKGKKGMLTDLLNDLLTYLSEQASKQAIKQASNQASERDSNQTYQYLYYLNLRKGREERERESICIYIYERGNNNAINSTLRKKKEKKGKRNIAFKTPGVTLLYDILLILIVL